MKHNYFIDSFVENIKLSQCNRHAKMPTSDVLEIGNRMIYEDMFSLSTDFIAFLNCVDVQKSMNTDFADFRPQLQERVEKLEKLSSQLLHNDDDNLSEESKTQQFRTVLQYRVEPNHTNTVDMKSSYSDEGKGDGESIESESTSSSIFETQEESGKPMKKKKVIEDDESSTKSIAEKVIKMKKSYIQNTKQNLNWNDRLYQHGKKGVSVRKLLEETKHKEMNKSAQFEQRFQQKRKKTLSTKSGSIQKRAMRLYELSKPKQREGRIRRKEIIDMANRKTEKFLPHEPTRSRDLIYPSSRLSYSYSYASTETTSRTTRSSDSSKFTDSTGSSDYD